MAGDSANSEISIPDAKRLKLSMMGKAPIDYPNADTESSPDAEDPKPLQRCGICLSEEGQAVRGYIDCCDHHFCFLCILEWSRTESRCPMCKRRFGIIRRMRKDGTLIGERAVTVPARDQVYHPFGDITGPVNPYANINCSVCHGNSNECFLLFCDICDSAMHTYCAGLGFTVPEGDWFCQECTLMKSEGSNIENNSNRDIPSPSYSGPAPVSIFDIVRDSHEPNVEEIWDLVLPSQGQSSLPSGPVLSNAVGAISRKRKVPEASLGSKHRPTETGSRTLQTCRNVHTHLRALHENRSAIRNGSLSFSSNFSDSSEACSNSGVTVAVHGNFFSSSANGLEEYNSGVTVALCGNFSSKSANIPEACNSGVTVAVCSNSPSNELKQLAFEKSGHKHNNCGNSSGQNTAARKYKHNAEKAWKMLDLAKKSMQPPKKMTGIVSSTSVAQSWSSRALKAKKVLLVNLQASGRAPSRTKDAFCGVGGRTANRMLPESSSGKCLYLSSKNSNMSVPADTCGVHLGTASRLHSVSCGVHLGTASRLHSVSSPETRTLTRFQPAFSSGICTVLTSNGTNNSNQDDFSNDDIDMLSREKLGRVFSHKTNASPPLTSAASDDQVGKKASEFLSEENICGKCKSKDHLSRESEGKTHPSSRMESHRRNDGKNHFRRESRENSEENTHSSSMVESHQGYDGAERVQKQSQRARNSDAKSEIASLVKLNLKLLSVDKKYGTDVFKDSARRSTHEILAACGLDIQENREHSAARHILPTSVCCHYDQMKKAPTRSLLSNCCRECFYAFVKEVVNSIMSKRLVQ